MTQQPATRRREPLPASPGAPARVRAQPPGAAPPGTRRRAGRSGGALGIVGWPRAARASPKRGARGAGRGGDAARGWRPAGGGNGAPRRGLAMTSRRAAAARARGHGCGGGGGGGLRPGLSAQRPPAGRPSAPFPRLRAKRLAAPGDTGGCHFCSLLGPIAGAAGVRGRQGARGKTARRWRCHPRPPPPASPRPPPEAGALEDAAR
jgi:hypothetical protein